MGLPVVSAVLEIKFLIRGRRCDGPEDYSVTAADTLRAEVCTAVESIIYPAAPAGADCGVGVDVYGEASLHGEGVLFVFVPPDVAGIVEGVLYPSFRPRWAAVIQNNGAHLDGAESEDTPAGVWDVGRPQAEADSAATCDRVCIRAGRRGRCRADLACSGEVS